MQEKIFELIVNILNEMQETNEFNEIDIKKYTSEGYTKAEINTAFAWIFSKIESSELIFNADRKNSRSHRVYHKFEKNLFAKEALGYMIQLKELGIITETDEESIIDKLISAGYKDIGIDEIKMIASTMIFLSSDPDNRLNRLILQNNDTIN
ncbi:MAG TPA: DUF494 family protein [Ignavibacteria bacterium]|nr:DUF494 family protein [Ignavibacteria bacterium]HQY52623.1 DUF494 family protein [Ignavibacteria bacterium]HRB00409.1 DUF494 family protein [Ignavibacteria bacterium]